MDRGSTSQKHFPGFRVFPDHPVDPEFFCTSCDDPDIIPDLTVPQTWV